MTALLPAGAGPVLGLCFPTIVCPSQVIGAGSSLAGSLAQQTASSVLDAVGSGLDQASAWVVAHVMDLILSSTTPRMGAGWIVQELGLMERVAITIILPVLMAATIGAVLRQDGRRLFRVWGVGLPLGLFAGLAGSQLAGWGLAVTDALCGLVIGSHSQDFGKQFSAAMTGPAVLGAPLFVQIILAVLTLAGAVLVWLELTVRSAGVLVATFFMPLTLVAYIWPTTAGLAKRGVEILVSLILSKFVIVSSLSLGLAALASAGGIDATVSGAAVLLIAAFAPFTLFRLAPVVEASAIAHLEGMSRRPGRAAARTATSAATAQVHPVTQLVMSAATRGGGATAGDGGLGVRPVAAQPIPEAAVDFPVRSTGSDGERQQAQPAGQRPGGIDG